MKLLQKINQEIKGHDFIQNRLLMALQKNRLPHALLFSGPSGIGKKQLAWALAQTLLCEKTKEQDMAVACNSCLACRNILKRESEHVLEIKHETLQIRLQDVRSILPFLSLQSFAKAKIVLIDEAEKLNSQASNFLLKTLEEPPPHSFFFLISSQSSQISLTIRSRVQNLFLSPLSENIIAQLSSADTPQWMIRSCRGQLDILQELQEKQELRQEAFDLFIESLNKSALEIEFSKAIKNRKTALNFLRFWRQFLRDMRLLGEFKDHMIHRDKTEEMLKFSHISNGHLDFWIKKTLDMEYELKSNFDYILCFENFVIILQKSLKSNFINWI